MHTYLVQKINCKICMILLFVKKIDLLFLHGHPNIIISLYVVHVQKCISSKIRRLLFEDFSTTCDAVAVYVLLRVLGQVLSIDQKS